MSMTIMFIAILVGVTVWWLLIQRLKTKTWAEPGPIDALHSVTTTPAPKVGLLAFLAVVTSLFLLFVSAYLMRMSGGHGVRMHDWASLSDPGVLWFNTALLMLASLVFQRARGAAEREHMQAVRVNLTAGGALTLAFLGGQLWAWQQLADAGQFVSSGPANAFFYLLTGVHGLHLAGGLWVWAKTTARVWRGFAPRDAQEEIGRVRLSVQLCTVYWHYLLLVWLGLFALLLMT